MAVLHIQFQVLPDEKHDFLINFPCDVPSLESELAVKLEPISGFENSLERRTIYATRSLPGQIYDEVDSIFFRAAIDNSRIILKFASGPGVLGDMQTEAEAYRTMKDLQGKVIPFFMGLYTVIDDPETMCLITSDVGDSIEGNINDLPKKDRSVFLFGLLIWY